MPAYDELIFVTRSDNIDNPRILAFLAAIEAGTQYLINHPDAAWELFIKGRKELDDELNRRAWRDTIPRFALRPAALDRGRYERFAQFLKARDMIETIRPVESYAVEVR